MKKLLLLLSLICLPAALMGSPTAEEIVRKADTFRSLDGGNSFQFELFVSSHKPEKKARKNKLQVMVKSESSLVRFLAPKRDKGRAILTEGRNMWIKMPGTRRPIRISPAQRLLGEASNGDVASTNFSGDYTPTLQGEVMIAGQKTWHLSLKANNRKVTYGKIEYWVAKDSGKPVKSKHYALSGKLLKIALYKGFSKFQGEEKLSKILLVDPIAKGSYTWMVYKNYQKANFSDALFRKENLNRL